MKHSVIFAGAGPGDPELITVKAQRAIEDADLILYTGSLVPEAVLQRAKPGAERIDSASLHLAQIVGKMVDGYRAGKRVLRLHTGDPSLYGAIFEQMVELDRESVPYRIIPGVTAAFAAAAALGIEYTLPEITQTLILTRMGGKTPVPASESLASLASHRASMAIYLSIGLIEEVQSVLKDAYGPDAGCAVVYRAGHPDEKVVVTRIESLVRRVKEEKITRQAVIIVAKAIEARHGGGDGKAIRSKLYDEGFNHGYRSAGCTSSDFRPQTSDFRCKMMPVNKRKSKPGIAIWAVTPGGARLAQRIASNEQISRNLSQIEVFLSSKVHPGSGPAFSFERLSVALEERFHLFSGHIFIMAAGIVVRAIAPLIREKTTDPAVVVADEAGRHVVSLLSGHIGGANRLAIQTAEAIGAEPVLTTATDINRLPAVDAFAAEEGLAIQNPEAIREVHMALLRGERVACHDPLGLISEKMAGWIRKVVFTEADGGPEKDSTGIFVSDEAVPLPSKVLVLRPKTLVAGIGCNRNTPMAEIEALLREVFERFRYSPSSLALLATADIKADEAGLLELARRLDLPVEFYDRNRLNAVEGIRTPSGTVEKHVGAKSVCEAAAILASNGGKLIVPKQISKNVTLAIARRSFTS